MKRKLVPILAVGALCLSMVCGFSNCQSAVKSSGGSMTLRLEPNQKLEMITWKDDDSLWYLTKPMTDDDIAETHTFQQSSEWGVFEGTVTIIETKE